MSVHNTLELLQSCAISSKGGALSQKKWYLYEVFVAGCTDSCQKTTTFDAATDENFIASWRKRCLLPSMRPHLDARRECVSLAQSSPAARQAGLLIPYWPGLSTRGPLRFFHSLFARA